jgi:flavin reductase
VVDRKSFREAMARLGAAVNVVTSGGPAGSFGFTASAVCSVTDDPPTMLVCMNRGSTSNEAFKANGVLCVNTLAADQEQLSTIFAGFTDHPIEHRFTPAVAAWSTLVTGAPVLDGAVVSFDCRIAQTTEVGTHSVFFCEVDAIRQGNAQEPLIYFGRAYHRIVTHAA